MHRAAARSNAQLAKFLFVLVHCFGVIQEDRKNQVLENGAPGETERKWTDFQLLATFLWWTTFWTTCLKFKII
jgi:hypothetical protein